MKQSMMVAICGVLLGYCLLNGETISGSAEVQGPDLRLGLNDGRDKGSLTLQRALVHFGSDELFVNYNGDFEGGIRVNGSKVIVDGLLGVNTLTPSFDLDVHGSVRLGGFSANDTDEWPRIVFHRGSGWDAGIIKNSSIRSIFGRAGFGIHMHSNRQFGFFSSGWDSLLTVKGGTGETYIKGSTGIGIVPDGTHKLEVNGTIRSKEIIVESVGWSDFVFAEDYELKSLSEVSTFIKENGRLPDIPSAEQVAENGISLGEMNASLLQKVEELTLHLIQLQEEVDQLKSKNP